MDFERELDWDSAKEVFENVYVMVFLCFVAMVVVGFLYESFWIFGFSASISYVGFDAVFSFLFENEDINLAEKTGLRNENEQRGVGYLTFFIFVIFGTALISWAVNQFLTWAEGSEQIFIPIVTLSAIACMALFIDANARF